MNEHTDTISIKLPGGTATARLLTFDQQRWRRVKELQRRAGRPLALGANGYQVHKLECASEGSGLKGRVRGNSHTAQFNGRNSNTPRVKCRITCNEVAL